VKKTVMATSGVVMMLAVAASGQVLPPALQVVKNMTGTTGGPPAPLPATQVIPLTVSAKAPQRPVLHYSLVTRVEDRQPGNAATYYEAAAMEVKDVRLPADYSALEEELGNKPAAELTAADMKRMREAFPFKTYWVNLGSQRSRVEWPFEIREGMTALLPSLGTYRLIARRLAVEAKWDIHEKRYNDSIDKMRMGVALGRHMGEGDTLIEGMVGVIVCEVSLRSLTDLVQQPDAPNLYWSLSQLPQPLVRLQLANERGWVYFSLPELQKVRKGTFTDGDWEALMARLGSPMGFFAPNAQVEGMEIPEWSGRLALVAINLRAYPRARAFLKEQGKSDAELEAMGAKKVLAAYYVDSFETWMDEATKAAMLPQRELHQVRGDWTKEMSASPDFRMNPLLMLIPALGQGNARMARADRSVALLRVVEALRMYAAEHEGRWPAKLEECAVPIPEDPLTGKDFDYKLADGKAMIESLSTNARDSVRYELTLRK
jgi:hypothetical protein